MIRRFTSSAAILLMAPIVSASLQQPSSVDRVVEDAVRIRLPLLPCAVPGFAGWLARSARVPVGIEAVPEPCRVDRKIPSDPANDVLLQGISVRDAFDKLMQLDPRYTWTDADGVLVIRPVLASNDPSHFLHQSIPSFHLVDERLSGALHAIQTALSPFPFPGGDQFAPRSPEGDRRFSVSLNATSILEALNTSVRAHKSMWWQVSYCQPAARYEYATIRFITFDGSGLGSHASTRRDDGAMFDACRPGK